jgi:hypothetical protein
MERAMQELHKIKKSFPLSEHDYLKLTEQSIEKYDIWDCVDHIQNMQQSVRENLSYLLYALYVQKYEESQEQKPLLLQYYDQLGYQEMEAKELIRENEETYNTVTGEQHRYLSMARGMVNNLAPSMPNIDVRSIADRTQQMAANDPYRLRKKKRPGDALLRQRKISDLFFEAPQVCIQAGAVAVAQLELDDSGKETTRETAKKWGAEDSDVDLILQEAEKIQKKVQKES